MLLLLVLHLIRTPHPSPPPPPPPLPPPPELGQSGNVTVYERSGDASFYAAQVSVVRGQSDCCLRAVVIHAAAAAWPRA